MSDAEQLMFVPGNTTVMLGPVVSVSVLCESISAGYCGAIVSITTLLNMDRPQSFSQCVEYFNTAAGHLPEMILTGTDSTILTNVLLIYYTIVCSYSKYVYYNLL